VFVINLKDRHDKLDAVQLAASLTGIHVDVIEGVRGADISNKALPPKGVPDVSVAEAPSGPPWELTGTAAGTPARSRV
jgi:hypothetical protein